jgi:uncharacterized membrane-anchored protein
MKLADTRFNSATWKLVAYAFCAGAGALVVGVCLMRVLRQLDGGYLTVMILFGAGLVSDLLWTRREVRRLATSETTKKHATQFLWGCIFFSMICFSLGSAIAGYIWGNTAFMGRSYLIFWGGLTGVATYPLLRDAKRLGEALTNSTDR